MKGSMIQQDREYDARIPIVPMILSKVVPLPLLASFHTPIKLGRRV